MVKVETEKAFKLRKEEQRVLLDIALKQKHEKDDRKTVLPEEHRHLPVHGQTKDYTGKADEKDIDGDLGQNIIEVVGYKPHPIAIQREQVLACVVSFEFYRSLEGQVMVTHGADLGQVKPIHTVSE